jgi:hypothetical protein
MLQNNLFALRASTSWPSGPGIIYLNCVLPEIETKQSWPLLTIEYTKYLHITFSNNPIVNWRYLLSANQY